ncbi:unnamed protein product [Larinioides sclopetarius]|uniref:Uncharacterized protein n=1 Tax=Larinioides sclopetarius TaxID=280406 RepID=A0AAV2B1W7_9ARAC
MNRAKARESNSAKSFFLAIGFRRQVSTPESGSVLEMGGEWLSQSTLEILSSKFLDLPISKLYFSMSHQQAMDASNCNCAAQPNKGKMELAGKADVRIASTAHTGPEGLGGGGRTGADDERKIYSVPGLHPTLTDWDM